MRRVVNQNIQKRKFTVVLFLESKFDVGLLRVDEIKESKNEQDAMSFFFGCFD